MLDDERRAEWNSHIRGGWIAVWLYQGSELSTGDIVRLTGMSKQGVEFMMDILSHGMPIVRRAGRWAWLHNKSSMT